jgi:FtsH-binding integral membrane protein
MARYAKSSLYKTLFGGAKGNAKSMGMIGGAKSSSDFYELMMSKKEFLLYVFSNLIFQLGITYYLMMNYKGPIPNHWIILFASLTILLIMIFVPMPSFMKFILFCAFSAVFGISFSRLRDEQKDNKDVIQMAVLGTLSIFGVLFLFGAFLLFSGIKLGIQFASFLLFALLLFIIVQIVMLFSGTISQNIKGMSIAGLFLFSLYIIYDTNNILQRDYYGDFITASMDYYLDIINLFINLFNYENN